MKKPKLFYGWVLAACCCVMVCATSLLSTGMSTNLAIIRQTYGFTGTQTSVILTIRSASAFLAALFSGNYYRALGLKKGMVGAMLLGLAAFLLYAFAGACLPVYYVGGAVSGLTYTYGMMLPSAMLLRRWFNRGRGTALAIASGGTGLVSVIFAPLVQSVSDRVGIRAAFLMQGGVLLGAAVLLALAVAENPADKGQEIRGGDAAPAAGGGKRTGQRCTLTRGWTLALVFGVTLVGMTASPASAHFTLNFTTEGIEPMAFAGVLSVYGIVLTASKIGLFGPATDKLGALPASLLFGGLTVGGMVCCFLASRFPTLRWAAFSMVFLAIGIVYQTLCYSNWCAELDTEHYDRTLRRCQTGYQFGALVGSPLPGILFDLTGSYTWAYLVFAAETVIALLIAAGAYRFGRRSVD